MYVAIEIGAGENGEVDDMTYPIANIANKNPATNDTSTNQMTYYLHEYDEYHEFLTEP